MTSRTAADFGRPVEILLVEDNAADVWLTTEQLSLFKIANRISIVADGVEAMAFLHREGKHADAARPDLVLLDLNLPRKSGREVLAEMKADPALAAIPVIVLTTSDAEADVLRSYSTHANCYVTKPLDLEQFARIVRSLEEFWFTIVRLPSR